MNEEGIKDIVKQEKLYRNSNRAFRKTAFCITAVAIIYVFFWTSGFTMTGPITKESGVSKIGAEFDFAENRSVRLISATYSAQQEMMELVLNFHNKNYDNVNDYYYVIKLLRGNADKVTIDEVYHEELFTVLRFRGLKDSYKELTLYFAPKTVPAKDVTDEMTGVIRLNKYNVSLGAIDMKKTKTGYLADRIQAVIADCEKTLKEQQAALSEYEARADALLTENKELAANEKYMTQEEILSSEQTIAENELEYTQTQMQIGQQREMIAQTEQEIADAKEKQRELLN